MLDFSFGELLTISIVALVVLGPERLPRVAHSIGTWLGKAQRYVSQVKADIDREIEASEFKRIRDEATQAARSFESTVRGTVSHLASDLQAATSASEPMGGTAAPDPFPGLALRRRYRPGPSIDQLAEEVARLKRQLALPDSRAGARHRYAPRARVNRIRIRR